MFTVGKLYHRQNELHDNYGGNRQSGISSCASHPIVFIFTSPRGEEFGYSDSWLTDSIFRYSGEGHFGDMEMARGNIAVRDHVKNGKKLMLFDRSGEGYYEFLGEMRYHSHRIEKAPDVEGRIRKSIAFSLERV